MLFEIGEIIVGIGATAFGLKTAKESLDDFTIITAKKKFVEDFVKGNKKGQSRELLTKVFVEKYNKKGTVLSLLDVKRMLIQYAPKVKTDYYEVKRIYGKARKDFIYNRNRTDDDIRYIHALDKMQEKDSEYEWELLNKIKSRGTVCGKLKESWPSDALAYVAILLDKYDYNKGEIALLIQQLAYDDETIADAERGDRAIKDYKAQIRRERRENKEKQSIK